MTTTKTETFVQIYTPVTHSNGERLVQVTNEDGAFCGWADGRGKYDIVGEWTIDEHWSPEQTGTFGHTVAELKSYARVEITQRGSSRVVAITL